MKRSFLFALIVFICFSQVWADSTAGRTSIEINLPSGTLSLYRDGSLLKEYPVCVGKPSTPTPQGEYKVIYKTINPYWINKDNVVPPGPQNPLGVRWIGITKSIGIHGNNRPDSIGTYASAGCIRMYNRDVEEVYALVPVSTPVTVKYDRVKDFEDKYSGKPAAILYPDSYKTGNRLVLDKLSRMELPEELMEKAREALKRSFSSPLAIAQGIGVFLNNSLITCDAFEEQGEIYVNYKAAEDVLGLTSETAGLFDIGTMELDGTIYVNLTETVKKFGGASSYDKTGGNMYITMKIIKVNGAFAGLNYGDYDKVDFISAESVKQLGYEYSEDSVDVRLFDKELIKAKRKNVWSLNVDNIAAALDGHKSISSQYGVVDLKLPSYVKFDNEYYITDKIDGRLMLNAGAVYTIHRKTGWAEEAFSGQVESVVGSVDLETFLQDFDYVSNAFSTLIDIKMRKN